MATPAKKTETLDSPMINLDAALAARREAMGTAPTVVFGGETYELPIEIPVSVVVLFAQAAEGMTAETALDIMREFLGDQYDQFMANRPSVVTLTTFIEGLMKTYGTNSGESQASEAS